jgi:hypothetical protein
MVNSRDIEKRAGINNKHQIPYNNGNILNCTKNYNNSLMAENRSLTIYHLPFTVFHYVEKEPFPKPH